MTARDRAIDIVRDALSLGDWTRETFLVMLADKCEIAANIRKWVAAVERGIEADRKATASARAPS